MTSPQRHGLGRGLSALIPAAPRADAVELVDVDLISPNPQQPRQHFDETQLRELADSIREHGVIQPLIVTREQSDLGPATYRLVAGERRLQASKLAGLERVPVIVKEATDTELLEIALVENLQRADLNPLEEAQAFRRLSDEFGLTQEAIAQRVGRSRVAVSNTIRLLSLEDDIRRSLASGQITEGHARALLAIEESATRLDAWRRIVQDALTVRQAEEIAKELKAIAPPKHGGAAPRRIDPQTRAVEDQLRHALGARVSISRGRSGGRIIITFHNDDELEGIIGKISGS